MTNLGTFDSASGLFSMVKSASVGDYAFIKSTGTYFQFTKNGWSNTHLPNIETAHDYIVQNNLDARITTLENDLKQYTKISKTIRLPIF